MQYNEPDKVDQVSDKGYFHAHHLYYKLFSQDATVDEYFL